MLHPTLEKVRIASAKVYKEMIKTNLSILLTIETGFNFDELEVVVQKHAGMFIWNLIFVIEMT